MQSDVAVAVPEHSAPIVVVFIPIIAVIDSKAVALVFQHIRVACKPGYIVMAYIVMAYIVMAYIVTAYILMAFIALAYVVLVI